MKKILFALLLSLTSYCFAESFTDPHSGITLEIPPGFRLSEGESKTNREGDAWWYVFTNSNHSIITIEVEEYDHTKSLSEYFHYTLTDEESELEKVIYEGLEFKNIEVEGLNCTKCKLRILAVFDQFIEPLFICDYLFVEDHFGFLINLMKRESSASSDDNEEMMLNLLKSIRFNK